MNPWTSDRVSAAGLTALSGRHVLVLHRSTTQGPRSLFKADIARVSSDSTAEAVTPTLEDAYLWCTSGAVVDGDSGLCYTGIKSDLRGFGKPRRSARKDR